MNKYGKKIALTITAVLVLVTAITAVPTQAAVPTLQDIRVAMFMQLPGKYDQTTAAATFQSAGGMGLGVREPEGATEWLAIPKNESIRIALDDFKVKLMEHKSFSSAWAVYQYVIGAKGAAYITSVNKNGAAHYQVFEGAYKTAAEASAALARLNADAKLSALLQGFKPETHGPLRMESPGMATEQAAQSMASTYGAAGFDAYVAVRGGASAPSYSVMVGGASTQEEFAKLQAAAVKAPSGASLKPVDASSRYLLIRPDYGNTAKADASQDLYMLPAGDMKVWLTPKADSPIGLKERSNRTYRGSFELSAYNGKLAVVNELPFEEYLYSVVAVEMYTSWPIEALKAQAVAARSYALNKGFGFGIAHVVDTTLSQAYYGTGVEKPSSTEAVEATRGEVAIYNGKVIEAVFSSNGGGVTADARDIWGNAVPYLQSVQSPDESSEAGLYQWHRIVTPDGKIGYVREDLVRNTGMTTAAGSRILELTSNGTNIRRHPLIQDTVPVVTQLQQGDKVVELEQVIESNPMHWVRGPFSGEELLAVVNARANPKVAGPITTLEVSLRGLSGRATEMKVNGTKLGLSSPDTIRSALGVGGSLPSTLFEVEETGKVAILGAAGQTSTKTDAARKVYVMGADGKSAAYSGDYMYAMNADGEIRAATKDPAFAFSGTGFGHGVGLSQYGALSLAQQGYDYEYILKYYYNGITLAKE
ncbi:SpoIID/LytB domain-containing protein [Paenibacillus soyae]|uniref:SpoIID/LytB domain-containing protein n=1 Tax=Paenibacillus soyae TaxID=2969249 RepID=A0A9X2MMV9_9BACL|nr:SpoIID/LytB domain-containing protein [Paenibacillus soyae]MCR2802653.1 SpoIID/LytB domain-containing protein [Paenibacillus soyae]